MERFIIYGAGKKGKAYLQFLKKHNLERYVYGFCDLNAEKLDSIDEKPVMSYTDSKKLDIPYVIGVRKEFMNEAIEQFINDGVKYYTKLDDIIVDKLHIMSRTEYEREFCAVSHIDTMDEYFESAENSDNLNVFWGNGPFRSAFEQLDLSSVVELACGRGRHVPKYQELAGEIVLVDILEKNIEYCKRRFAECDNISYITNNGYDLSDLSDESYSALFSYDAMVHFELMDIANYLKETYRILRHGGKALFHHSNNYSDYRASYSDAIHSRSFMSDKIFAYLAYRAGFEIIEQQLIDWEIKDLDCLTLLLKR